MPVIRPTSTHGRWLSCGDTAVRPAPDTGPGSCAIGGPDTEPVRVTQNPTKFVTMPSSPAGWLRPTRQIDGRCSEFSWLTGAGTLRQPHLERPGAGLKVVESIGDGPPFGLRPEVMMVDQVHGIPQQVSALRKHPISPCSGHPCGSKVGAARVCGSAMSKFTITRAGLRIRSAAAGRQPGTIC